MAGDDGAPEARRAVTGVMDEFETRVTSLERNPLLRYVLISGNRLAVSVIALSLVGLGLVGLGVGWTAELTRLFVETAVVQTILIALLSGIILLVSIAVSVNSIVLSQEITDLGEQEERIDETFSFRNAVGKYADTNVSPVHPAAFLEVIFDAARSNARELLETVPDDSRLHDQVAALTDDVVDQVEVVEGRLERGQFGTSEVLLAGITYDYSRQIYAARLLRSEYEDDLTTAQGERIEELITVLKYATIGREYFKTLYFKREMANLSRGLLALAFPSIVFLSYAILTLRAGLLPDISLLGIPSIVLFVGVAFVVGLAPYTLFSAYVFRTATIALETLAAGPFVLQTDPDGGILDREAGESTGN